MSAASLPEGVIVQLDRRQCLVEVETGERLVCTLRGRFFAEEGSEVSKPVAVGDRVLVRADQEQGTIEEVLPRRTSVARHQPRSAGKVQVLAANVDQLVIVASLRRPKPRPGMLDRLLVVAESSALDALIILNKIDLSREQEVVDLARPYEQLGYRVAPASATEQVGIDQVRDALRDRLSVMVGHSGVGKSSLLNAVAPGSSLRVGELRHGDRGRHTTTASTLLPLPFGGRVIDSPGVREFSLVHVEPPQLGMCFREIAPLHRQCRFSTCTHVHEPDCAVKLALEDGRIRAKRYRSYCKLLEELHGAGERMPRHDAF